MPPSPHRRWRALAVTLAILGAATLASGACGGGDHDGAPDAGRDAFHDTGGSLEVGACGPGDVFCGGVCQPEGVQACSASCKVCPQPASSHGMASCVSSVCNFECEGGYAMCGTESCCGAKTSGQALTVAVGGDAVCVVMKSGGIMCWGDGSYGMLGQGGTAGQSSLPGQVIGLPVGATRVSMGDHHACALLSDQSMKCWGDDEQGQLGDGSRTPRGSPIGPSNLGTDIAAIATGGSHTCALTQQGAVWCWGDNSQGQVGNPAAMGSTDTPAQVTALTTGVKDIAAGEAFTCAVLGDGTVACWGDGSNGELGGPPQAGSPVKVAMPAPVVSVRAGARHACALLQGGAVACWGAGDADELGAPAPSVNTKPVTVPGVSGATALGLGGKESCAIDAQGAARCWGADPVGDVGMGPTAVATVVPSLTGGMAVVAATSGYACGVTSGGAAKCWGTNASGQLGDGTMVTSWAPIDVMGL